MPDDYYVSQYSGEEWDSLLAGGVRYDAAQSLTDAQKAQARGNINAAPGGYGLGGSARLLTADDNLDSIWEAGWYGWDAAPQNAPSDASSGFYGGYCSMLVVNKAGGYVVTQIVFSSDRYIITRTLIGDTWSEWEYVNPPMTLGVEYRTTERYLDKPVYAQVVNFGNFPNTTTKSVDWASAGSVYAVIGASLSADNGDLVGGASVSGVEFAITPTKLVVKTTADCSSNTGRFIVKYIKTTD